MVQVLTVRCQLPVNMPTGLNPGLVWTPGESGTDQLDNVLLSNGQCLPRREALEVNVLSWSRLQVGAGGLQPWRRYW